VSASFLRTDDALVIRTRAIIVMNDVESAGLCLIVEIGPPQPCILNC
jgi:hypothetical protein